MELISRPIFLVGAERSGTTLLRLMLACHPQIAWCNEFEYTVDRLDDLPNWPDLAKYYEWLETHRIFQGCRLAIDRHLSYPELVDSFLKQQRERQGKSIVGATVHRHFDRLLQVWPDARFIHITRDGRDVAKSCIGMGWAGNVWMGVERWIEVEHLWAKLKESLPQDRQVEVTYETLIAEPALTLSSLCDFIGVPYSPTMLDYPQTTSYSSPDPRSIQQWQTKLSEREIQLVESRIATMLTERGYELSGLPLLTVTPAMEQKLRLQDWWARVQFRIKRMGFYLFAVDYLSRHLSLKQWQKQIRLKLNTMEAARLK
jgi:LPS sulfotransferase NodH